MARGGPVDRPHGRAAIRPQLAVSPRMELRHRDTYRARWQERWQAMTADAKLRIEGLNSSNNDSDACATSAEALARWRRERPAMLNDTRKLMGAALLLLAPPPRKRVSHPQ